jgi:hypothetical protein
MSFDITAALPQIQAYLDSDVKHTPKVMSFTTSDILSMTSLLESAAKHDKTQDDVEHPSADEMFATKTFEDRSQSFYRLLYRENSR